MVWGLPGVCVVLAGHTHPDILLLLCAFFPRLALPSKKTTNTHWSALLGG